MDFTNSLLLVKTAKGNEEIATRRNNLNPRLRQLLILIDGRRTFEDLSRMMGEKEAVAYAMALESEGFIDRRNISSSSGVSKAEPAHGPRSLQPSAFSEEPEMEQAAIALLEKPPVTIDFLSSRQSVARALNDSLGPFAEAISLRVEKSKNFEELRELLPAAASVVEAVRGKAAMAEFVKRVGKV